MFKLFAVIANVRYIIEMISKAFSAISDYIKTKKNAAREKAYDTRIEERTAATSEIEVEAKKEPTEESDEELRRLHRNVK